MNFQPYHMLHKQPMGSFFLYNQYAMRSRLYIYYNITFALHLQLNAVYSGFFLHFSRLLTASKQLHQRIPGHSIM